MRGARPTIPFYLPTWTWRAWHRILDLVAPRCPQCLLRINPLEPAVFDPEGSVHWLHPDCDRMRRTSRIDWEALEREREKLDADAGASEA